MKDYIISQESLATRGVGFDETIGYGHKITTEVDLQRMVSRYGKGTVLSQQQASELLDADLRGKKSPPGAFGLAKKVTVPVTQAQYDGLIQLEFGGAYDKHNNYRSSVYEALNRGESPEVVAENFFENWLMRSSEIQDGLPGPRLEFKQGLIERRIMQALTFLTGRIEEETTELQNLAGEVKAEREQGKAVPVVPRILELPKGKPIEGKK